jgi:hypothetical protein
MQSFNLARPWCLGRVGPAAVGVCVLSVALAGCAPTQMIGLSVSPEPAVLFVDGKRLDELPESVELTANKDHTLFLQREGYRSQLIIVRTAEREGGEDFLSPERVEVLLKREARSAPGITVEIDEAEEERAP